MTEPTNTVRNSLAEKARTLTLGPDALHWSDASGGESHLAYKDVRDLRLIAFALPVGETFQCTLRGKKGDKVKLRSAHYQSLNNFEDRTATYAPPVGAWVIAIGVCIASVPLAWRRIREGSAHSFDPAAPTPELIGRG